MALHQVLCGFTAVILLSTRGSCQTTQSPPPKCGMAVGNTRIVGGQDSSPGSWTWQVDLHNDDGHICGGSLISDQWVLTASHCIIDDADEIQVFLGRHSQSGPNANEISRGVVKAECHPDYDFLNNENDICLLELSSPVEFDDYIQPVCLASAESEFYTGTKSWVTGWGTTDNGTSSDILQEVNVPIVGNNECGCSHFGLTENILCAGARGKDACKGDSGGPLVSKYSGVWIQSGVVSFGDGCGETPGGYARVSQYEEWISNIIGNSSLPGFVTFNSPGVDPDLNFTCPTPPPEPTDPAFTYPPTKYPPHKTTQPTAYPPHTKFPPQTTEGGKGGGSIFDSGENLIRFSHFTHFFSLCGFLVLSFYALV